MKLRSAHRQIVVDYAKSKDSVIIKSAKHKTTYKSDGNHVLANY